MYLQLKGSYCLLPWLLYLVVVEKAEIGPGRSRAGIHSGLQIWTICPAAYIVQKSTGNVGLVYTYVLVKCIAQIFHLVKV